MPELTPLAFGPLVRRMFYEFRREGKIFDLQSRYFWRGTANPDIDFGVWFHDRAAATPLGPAAGPQTQLAQNIILSWLGGSRIMELKTIQIDDRLHIPRPCIDATNVGYNIEFSQELLLEQSLDEYVKAWMLLRMLEESELLGIPKRTAPSERGKRGNFYDTIFDLSCGYNLEGIRSAKVQHFIRGMQDASVIIERLRAEIPDEFAEFRKIDYNPHIVGSATLSTFHNCPPNEIEGIADHLLRENRLHTIVKMNPTMLGGERLRELLHVIMGYTEIEVNPAALTSGLQFDDSVAMMRRLRKTAHEIGLVAGAKFSNTLEVLNHRDFFPKSEKIMYLSGAPLHPITLELALRFREAYLKACSHNVEDKETGYIPISFSAGVDKHTFANCMACGFVPITTCTDLLKPTGYARQIDYLKEAETAFAKTGANTISDFIANGSQVAPTSESIPRLQGRGMAKFSLANHRRIAEATVVDPRYGKAKNSLVPKRINSHLWVFDCITCDKCIPVCPNDANFTFSTPDIERTYSNYELSNAGELRPVEGGLFKLKKSRQIANYSAFCNECGNCDTFCPEYGGPFIEKPTFFPTFEQWQDWRTYDGFFICRTEDAEQIFGRIKQVDYSLRAPRGPQSGECSACDYFNCPAGQILIDRATSTPHRVIETTAPGFVDMNIYLTLRVLLEGVLHDKNVNYVNIDHSDILAT